MPVPLVSCIMPTHNRRFFVERSLTYFLRQDYPNLELIVLDDGSDPVADLMPDDPRVRYKAVPPGLNMGDKRNLTCELAKGLIIAEWDDDDWYAPNRITHQIVPLLRGEADITGIVTRFFDLDNWQGWLCTPELHRRMFEGDVHGGTLVFWRWVWERLARYPSVNLAEDALFQRAVRQKGAVLGRLPNEGTFVYVRHGRNSWHFRTGTHIDSGSWQQVNIDSLIPPDDLPPYSRYHETAATIPVRQSHEPPPVDETRHPLVTCIMPTYNRRAFVPMAITCFQRQDYPNRELLVLDDGADPVADLMPDDARIRYVRLNEKVVLGRKRNIACELARGSVIAHWDDDDWSAPHRLSYQLAMLELHQADLCGANRQLYYDPIRAQAWLYDYPVEHERFWVTGNTLMYRKTLWQHNPFPAISTGEDTRFIWATQAPMLALPDHQFYVGLIHAHNASAKRLSGACWKPCPVEDVYAILGEDRAFYESRMAAEPG